MVVAYLRTSCMIGKPRYTGHHAADYAQVDTGKIAAVATYLNYLAYPSFRYP